MHTSRYDFIFLFFSSEGCHCSGPCNFLCIRWLELILVKGHIRIFGNFTCNPLTFLKGLLCEGTRRFEARLCWFCTLLYLQQRRNQTKYRELLAQRAQQFRTIQRRLLTRFKDKTPAPLANLDTLLDGTYKQVTKLKKKVLEKDVLSFSDTGGSEEKVRLLLVWFESVAFWVLI